MIVMLETTLLEKKTRLEKIELRISQLERQKKEIQLRENQKERKTRNRRLIQIGAITLQYLHCPIDIEPVEFEKMIRKALGIQPTEQKENKE